MGGTCGGAASAGPEGVGWGEMVHEHSLRLFSAIRGDHRSLSVVDAGREVCRLRRRVTSLTIPTHACHSFLVVGCTFVFAAKQVAASTVRIRTLHFVVWENADCYGLGATTTTRFHTKISIEWFDLQLTPVALPCGVWFGCALHVYHV
jgi:hypothetical protein